MTVDKRLERILPRVQKPARYVGGEYNAVIKDKAEVDTRIAFCFPDTYEIGMSNLGMRILYGVMNNMPGVWCERVFAPWGDMEEEMRKCIVPFVEENYSVIKDRHARAISGLSMGGRLSQYVGFRCLDLFGSFGLLSSAIDTKETPAIFEPDFNDKVDYLFLGAGTYETNPRSRHQLFHEELDKMGIKHEYYVGSNGAHDLVAWKHLLYYRFLPNLWRINYKW